MVKPQLPDSIRLRFPPEVVHIIASYVPHLPPKKEPRKLSFEAEKDIKKMSPKLTAMALYDLECYSGTDS